MAVSIEGNIVSSKRIADIIQVENKDKHFAAAATYNHLRVQFPGGQEIHLLFTDPVLKRALKRAKKNPEDLPKLSWFRDIIETEIIDTQRLGDLQPVQNQEKLPSAANKYNHIRVEHEGQEKNLLLTDHEIKVAFYRALKNPEDLPQVSWLRDILD